MATPRISSTVLATLAMSGLFGCGSSGTGGSAGGGADTGGTAGTGGIALGGGGATSSGGNGTGGTSGVGAILPRKKRIAAGARFECAVTVDRTISCWGGAPASAPTDNGWETVAAGVLDPDGGCAKRSTGDVVCWNPLIANLTPPGQFSDLAEGTESACALRATDHTPICWDASTDPSLTTGTPSLPLTELDFATGIPCALQPGGGDPVCWPSAIVSQYLGTPQGDFVQLAAMTIALCGLSPNGALTCWGDGPEAHPPAGPFIHVDGGDGAACALDTNGAPTCWGSGKMVNVPMPSGPFVELSVGGEHACGLHADGSVECWGNIDPPPAGLRVLTQ